MVVPTRIAIDAATSKGATVLMQILVNIATGDVNGMKEQIFIKGLSIVPVDKAVVTTKNAKINRKVTGSTEVLISSSLDAVDPIAPYRKA